MSLRLFFEELCDSGDRNAAAASALRRLVDGEVGEGTGAATWCSDLAL